MGTTLRQTATRLVWGATAGAVGTTVLNAVTYGDMLLRGRPSSGVPAKAAGKLADTVGFAPLSTGAMTRRVHRTAVKPRARSSAT